MVIKLEVICVLGGEVELISGDVLNVELVVDSVV